MFKVIFYRNFFLSLLLYLYSFGPAVATGKLGSPIAKEFFKKKKSKQEILLRFLPRKASPRFPTEREREKEESKDKGRSEVYIQSKNPAHSPQNFHTLSFQKISKKITPHHLPQPHHTIISASSAAARSRIRLIPHTNMMPKLHPPSIPIPRSPTSGITIPQSKNPLLFLLSFTHTCQGIKRHCPGRGWNPRTFQPSSCTRGAWRIHHFPWFLF